MKRMLLMGALALATGCGVGTEDALDGQSEVGSKEQAISTNGYASWGTPGNNGAPLDLGSDDERTCFLQGITGQMDGVQFGQKASVRVFRNNRHWWLQTKAGKGSGVMGHASCVPYTFHRRFLSWPGNEGNGSEYTENRRWLPENAVNATTKCFLTEVEVTTGFQSANAYVQVGRQHIYYNGRDFDSWSIGGNFTREQDSTPGGNATAVCLEFWHEEKSFDVAAPSNSLITSGPLSPVASSFCGVQQITGRFSDSDGWYDGVKLYPSGASFRAQARDGKRIEGTCYSPQQF